MQTADFVSFSGGFVLGFLVVYCVLNYANTWSVHCCNEHAK